MINGAGQKVLAASIDNLTPEEKHQAYDEEVAALRDRLTRWQSYVDGFPEALTEVPVLAETLPTAQTAFEFVRDHVAVEPYPGILARSLGIALAVVPSVASLFPTFAVSFRLAGSLYL